ncbi:tetratricopeptide repeat protein [Pseudomonas syringae]|uniref:tetratricopeptide repeat protein n=1 Tax=Pseudomonas syringae TaxID=317 RepID=UPI0010720C86|nr:tetratricopeptide repeat protein [Pseudomonas syringae]
MLLFMCAAYIPASQAALTINATRIVFDGDKRSTSVVISNPSDRPFAVQTWVNTEADDTVTVVPFAPSPPLFRLNPGKEQQVQINGLPHDLPSDRESLFYFNVQEIPQASQSQGASMLYQQLLETALTPSGQADTARVAEISGKLKSEFGGTTYAQFGSLFVAKVAVDAGKLDDAAAELKPVADKPANDTLGEIARQRLARVLAAQNKTDDALKLLDGDADKAFLASREELKGDLLVQLGRTDEAYAAYQKAKSALSEDAAVGGLQMKLDDLAKGDA